MTGRLDIAKDREEKKREELLYIKQQSKWYLAIKLSLALVLLVAPSSLVYMYGSTVAAFACTCAKPKSPEGALEQSTAVFAGKVTGIKINDSRLAATFDVDRTWKGISSEPVEVKSSTQDTACGYFFEEDKEYLVYAHGETELDLNTSSCGRTKPLETALADLVVLGEGLELSTATAVPRAEMWSYPAPFLLIGIATTGAAGVAILILMQRWRRKR